MALITGGLNTDRFDATSAVVEQDAHVATDFLQSRGLAKLPDNLGDYKLSALDAEELAGRFAPFAYKFYPLSTSDLIANGAVRSREFCNHRGLRYGQNPTETNSSVLDEIEKRTATKFGYHMTNGLSLAIMSSLGWALPEQEESSRANRVASGTFMMAFSAAGCLGYRDGGSDVVRIMREVGFAVSEEMALLAKRDVMLRVDLSAYRDQSKLCVVDLSGSGIITPCPPPLAFMERVVSFVGNEA